VLAHVGAPSRETHYVSERRQLRGKLLPPLGHLGDQDMLRRLTLAMSILGLGASHCLGQTSKSMLAQCREVVAHEKTPSPFPPDKVLGATACTNYIYGFVGGYLVTSAVGRGQRPNMFSDRRYACPAGDGVRELGRPQLRENATTRQVDYHESVRRGVPLQEVSARGAQ
jgi:hypothetical protein